MTNIKEQLAADSIEATASTSYWGMDVSAYPGDAAMQDWWNHSPFYYTGFYLAPTDNHKDTSWMSKRATVANQGWGFLPIYVGRQAGSSYLTSSQGKAEAQNAAALASKAGFPIRSYIYLDIEQGGTLSSAFIAYIKAWAIEIQNNTNYWPGIYCSYYSTANQIHNAIISGVRYWVYNLKYSGTPGSSPAPAPTGSGIGYATSWQLAQNKSKTYGSHTITIDFDSSSLSNPSI